MELDNVNSIRVISQKIAVNEYMTKYLVNKLSYVLLQNDINIYNFYKYFVMSGPGIYVNGATYEKGYKVWANGKYMDENGKVCQDFGIFISLRDNNTTNPETNDGLGNWTRFTIYDIREYNVNVFNIIKEYINKHITDFHQTVNMDNNLLLLKSLQNIIYPFNRYETTLNNYKITNTPNANQILEYNENIEFEPGAPNPRLIEDELKAVKLDGSSVQCSIDSEDPYSEQTAFKEWKNIVNADLWKYVIVKLDKPFIDRKYHIFVNATLKKDKSTSIGLPYIYNKQDKQFSILVKTPTGYYIDKIQVYCFGYIG